MNRKVIHFLDNLCLSSTPEIVAKVTVVFHIFRYFASAVIAL